MNQQITAKRITAIRRELKRNRISCLVLTNSPNVTYATGFMGGDSWAAVTKNRTYLLTDSRYTEQARKESPQCPIIERTGSMAQAVAKLLKRLKSVRTLTVEKSISLADFEMLARQGPSQVRCGHHREDPQHQGPRRNRRHQGLGLNSRQGPATQPGAHQARRNRN